MVKSWSYTLRCDDVWLGQVVITEDGMFAGVTDYGNFSFAWRAMGEDFKKFLMRISPGYFGSKMAEGMAYVVLNKKVDKACNVFAEKILPALQEQLRLEAASE